MSFLSTLLIQYSVQTVKFFDILVGLHVPKIRKLAFERDLNFFKFRITFVALFISMVE